ncbi:MAG: hypothetical protein K0M69_18250 [Youngiibacter sp.]|nr:hypothetical protein [Youngiibacter sp.]
MNDKINCIFYRELEGHRCVIMNYCDSLRCKYRIPTKNEPKSLIDEFCDQDELQVSVNHKTATEADKSVFQTFETQGLKWNEVSE